jgi:Domain of unknown function (DUF4157)
MAFALLTKPTRAAVVSTTTGPKRKSALGHRGVDARSGFAKPASKVNAPKPAAPPVIQTKLKVGAPNDEFEQEADDVAEEIMRTPDSAVAGPPPRGREGRGSVQPTGNAPLSIRRSCPACAEEDQTLQRMPNSMASVPRITALNGPLAARFQIPIQSVGNGQVKGLTAIHGRLQRTCACGNHVMAGGACEECSKKKTLGLQTKLKVNEPGDISERDGEGIADRLPATQRDSSGAFDPGPAFEAGVTPAQTSGAKLDPAARSFMESRFGVDFGQVRIHADNRAAALASAVHAEAFTLGHDIFFAASRYDPASHGGRALIAHELVHTIQQNGGQPRGAHGDHVPIDAADAKPASSYSGALQLVQRQETFVPADFRGMPKTWTDNHKEVFEQFGDAPKNADLFTEVKIPGAKKNVVELDKKGVADLYKVVKGTKTTMAVVMAGDEPAYLETDPKLRRGSERFEHKATGAPRGVDAGETSCTDEIGATAKKVCRLDRVPQKILIGDLKPASIAENLLGQGQIDDYQYGISTTADALNTFIENHPDLADPSGRKWHPDTAPLDGDIIPAGLKFGSGNTQQEVPLRLYHGKPGEAIPGLFGQRVVYRHPKIPGIWVYEWIPSRQWSRGERSERFLKAIDRLYILVGKIRKSDKTGQRKAATGPRQPFALHSPVLRSNPTARARVVQRKTPEAPGFDGPKWQQEYSDWKSNQAKAFLDSEEEKNVEVIATLSEVERHSGLPVKVPATAGKTAKDYKQLKLWSKWGGLFGRVRAALGPLFAKFLAFYEKAKEKFESLRQSKSLTDTGEGKILQSIIRVGFKAAATFFRVVIHRVTENLKRAVQRGAAALVRDYFGDENLEKVIEAKQDLELLAGTIENEGALGVVERITKIIGPFETVLNAITTVKEWLGNISKIEDAIRWGVRIIQCLTPPGVGCLKLILSFLFERAVKKLVDKVTATCWFQQNFVLPALRAFKTLKSLPDKISGFILDEVKEMLPFDKEFKEKLFPTEKVSEEISNKDLECTHQISKEAIEMNKLADRYGAAKLQLLIDILEKGGAGVDRALNLDDIKKLGGLLEKMRKGQLTEEQIAKALANHTPTAGFGDPILDQFMADFSAGGASAGSGQGGGLPNLPAAKANKAVAAGLPKQRRSNACASPALTTHRKGQQFKLTIWGEVDNARVQSVSDVPVEVLTPEEGNEKGKQYRWNLYRLKQNVVFDQFTVKGVGPFGYKADDTVYGCEKQEIGTSQPASQPGSKP